MSRLVVFAAVAVMALGSAAPAGSQDAKIKTLLITGDDVKPHPWKETSEATREVLTASGKFDVTVVEDLDILGKKDELQKFDLMIYMRYNTKKEKGEPSDEGKANLLDFVKGGKGFVVCHLASASFNKWEEWNKLCGRYWVMGKSGHGPRSVFKAKVVAKDNPIARGVEDFEVDDELYAKLLGEEKINVIVEADSDWSKKTEPLMFTLEYGKGRVFHNAFGHDAKPIKTPAVVKLMVRGCEWAATGKVSD
jgi:type 1 glutamine amidotransferase